MVPKMLLWLGLSYIICICVVFGEHGASFAEDWWRAYSAEEFPEDDELFTALGSSKLYIRSVDLDENHLHSCFEYKLFNSDSVISHSNTFCMPLIVVAGIRKCSTSALYNLLVQYPNALRIPNKENCVKHYSNIVEYFTALPTHIDKGQIFMDGCIEPPSNAYVRKLLKKINTFYLIVTRDYADWIWSAYNYWCNADYDGECKRKTVDVNMHKRSPELLHEMVVAGMEGKSVKTPLQLTQRPCENGEKRYGKIFNQMWNSYPLHNTLLLASEDLEENPAQVWTRIATAIGLNATHPHIKQFESVRYNAQVESNKTTGFSKTVNASTFVPGLYEVSGFKPMLPATQQILRKCWTPDCIYTSIMTRHMYAACKTDATKQNARIVQYLTYSIQDTTQKSNALRYMDTVLQMEKSKPDQFENFLSRIKNDRCEKAFNKLIEAYKPVVDSNNKSKDVKKSKSSSSNKGTKDNKKLSVNNVVILTTSKEDAFYVEQLLYYATIGTARVFNAFSLDEEVLTRQDSDSYDSVCASSSSGSGSGVVPSPLPIVTIAHPGTLVKTGRLIPVDPLIGHKETISHYFTLNVTSLTSVVHSQQCMSSVLYNKVVVLSTDLLTGVWAAYLKQYEFDSGLTESMLYRFNWHKWDTEALSLLKNLTSVETLKSLKDEGSDDSFSVYWNDAHLRPLVGTIGCESGNMSSMSSSSSSSSSVGAKMTSIEPLLDITVSSDGINKGNKEIDSTLVMISREDLMYAESRVSVLQQLLTFISPEVGNMTTSKVLLNTINEQTLNNKNKNKSKNKKSSIDDDDVDEDLIRVESFDQLKCAYKETVLTSVEDRYNHLRLSKHLHFAFADEDLVCALRHFIQHNVSDNSGGLLSPNSPEFSLLDNFKATCHGTAAAAVAAIHQSRTPTHSTTDRCIVRYADSSIRPTPVTDTFVLLGVSSQDLVNVRLLIEHGTGVMTGSVVPNTTIASIFESEELCSLTQSVVYMEATSVVLSKLTNFFHDRRKLIEIRNNEPHRELEETRIRKRKPRPASSVLSLSDEKVPTRTTVSYNVTTSNSKAMKKCMTNGIRGFGVGIMAIKDPLVGLYEQLKAKGKTTGKEAQLKTELLSLLNAANFTALINFPLNIMEKLHTQPTIGSSDFRVVSAEALLLPYSYGLMSATNKHVVMKQLAIFLGVPKPFQERLDCMYSFIPNYSTHLRAIEEAGSFYEAHKDIVCALNTEINRKLSFDGTLLKFRVYRLFVDEQC